MDIKALTVTEIKKLVTKSEVLEEELVIALAKDARAGVRRLYESLQKNRLAQHCEQSRMVGLFNYEDELRAQGINLVAGVDEVGRGPLAGPVVAAAVILPPRFELDGKLCGLDDSKRLSATKREALAGQIKKVSLAWAIGVSTVNEIFSLNIHWASMLAMGRAVEGLVRVFKAVPNHILVDGRTKIDVNIPQTPLVGGDGLSASIAAASIVAKVTRDQLMELCHYLYPDYGFDRHKGYPTADHLKALNYYGPCPLHREGFAPVSNLLNNKLLSNN